MAQTAVDVVVRVKDQAALERLKKSLAGVDGATLKAEKGIKRFENSIRRLQGVLGGLAVGDQLRRAFGAAANFSATEQRLNNLTKQYSQLAGIQELAAVSAQKFGISNAQAAADLADLGSRLGSAGANLKDLNDIYEGFNTLLAVNAVSSQQAASAQLQLNQALGSGRLAGEEFNAINEATPQLLDKVAEVMGVARGELKKLASEGQITSQILIEALRLSATEGGEALADFFKTPAGQLKLFQKAIEDFQVTVGQQLLPLLTPLIEAATALLGLFSQLPGPVKATAVAVTALGAAFAVLGGPITLTVAAIAGITIALKKLADENEAFASALKGAWNGILAALNGVVAFFQSFFTSITQQANEFIQYWQGIGTFLADTWNQGIANIMEMFGRWQQYYNQVVQAIADAWNQLMQLIPNAFLQAVTALGQIFSPFVDFLNQAFASISDGWNSLLESMGINWTELIDFMILQIAPLTAVFKAMGIDIGEAITGGVKAGFQAFNSFKPPEIPSLNLPGVSGLSTVPTGGAGGGGAGGGKGKGSKAASEAERLKQLEAERLAQAKELLALAQAELGIKQALTPIAQAQLESAERVRQINAEYTEKLAEATSEETRRVLEQAKGIELQVEGIKLEKELTDLRESAVGSIQDEIEMLRARLNGTEDVLKAEREIAALKAKGISGGEATALVNTKKQLEEQVKAQDAAKASAEELAGSIASSLTSSLRGLIDGSMSAEEALSNAFQGIADAFLDMAMQMIQEWIKMQLIGLAGNFFGGGAGGLGGAGGFGVTPMTSGMKFFADGGRPPVGEVSLVGERGPELFVPDSPGRIINNEQSQAAMSQYSPSNDERTAQASAPASYTFNTVRIADDDFVSKDQLMKAMDQATARGAKLGEQRSINRLRQSRSTRNKLGM